MEQAAAETINAETVNMDRSAVADLNANHVNAKQTAIGELKASDVVADQSLIGYIQAERAGVSGFTGAVIAQKRRCPQLRIRGGDRQRGQVSRNRPARCC